MIKGFKHSLETRLKMSRSRKGKKQPWMKGFFKGHKHTEETKRKISEAKKGQKYPNRIYAGKKGSEHHWYGRNCIGENNPTYIKDRTKLKRFNNIQKDRRSSAYVTWRKQVWLRDNFKCKIANPDCKGRLEAHHILGFTAYPELRYEINNGITLCHFHHPRKREDEKKLSPYFQKLVEEMQ